jgi:hypothetical protein
MPVKQGFPVICPALAPTGELTENATFQELRAIPLQLLNPTNRPCNHLEATHGTCFGFGAKAAYSGPSFAISVRNESSSIPLAS